MPDFGAHPTIVSVADGNWSNPSIWSAARVPTDHDVVSLAPNTIVSYDVISNAHVETVVIEAGAQLDFRTDLSTRLIVANFIVMAGGVLEVGTETDPVAAHVKAEILFSNQPLNTTFDPEQYGNGLIAMGTVTMHGAVKDDTFIRLAVEPRAGDTTLTLETPASGWQANDRLILPDSKQWARETRAYVPEWEEVRVASISADGKVVTLQTPLLYNHPGARNGDGVLEFLAHVGDLTRNVVVRSESSAGVRGYVTFLGRADVDIRYVQFSGLGRTTNYAIDNTTFDTSGNVTHIGTNQDGRFPVYFNHLIGPESTPDNGYQYTFVGNAVFCPMPDHHFKWGVTVNDSHYGLIQDNVIYNWAGSGLVTQSGNESYNVIDHNFVVRGTGIGGRDAEGNEGQAFWFRGPNNYVRDNVAANYYGTQPEAAYGYKYAMVYLGNIKVPSFKGADVSLNGQYAIHHGNAMPLLEFARNEAYGIENALTIWWLNAVDTAPQNGGTSVVKDFRTWHYTMYAFYGYPMADVVFDGFVVRGDRSVISNYYEFVMGIWFNDYMTKDVVIRHADIQGVRTGIVDPYFGGSTTLIEDSYLRNTVDISTVTIGAPGSGPYGPSRTPKSLIVRNVQFGSTANWNHGGHTPYSIARSYRLHDGSANLIASDTLYVYDYNGNPDDDFQVFYPQQQPAFIVPQASGNLAGSPEAGLTNQQNWDKYGIAIAGAVMPADAVARSGILGSVRPIVASPLPPVDHIVAVSPDPRTTAVASVDVVFAAPVDPNFFAWSNLTLRRNGGDNLINAAVTISALAADTFRIANLATLTGVEGDYVLTVEAGVGSKSEAWALDLTPPSVTVNQASNQADPTTDSPIQFAVVFSESVTGFAAADLQLSGTAAGSLVATVTGSGTTYNVAISGMTSGGTVQVAVNPDAAVDAAGNSSRSSTSIDNTVQFVVPGISVDVTLPAELNEGELLVAPGTISGLGPFTVVVDYGDQTAPETLPVANDGTFSLSHRYADNGNYSISLTATGKNGASDSEAASILVTNVAPQVTLSAPLDGFQGVRAQGREFEISATDASSTDQASLFTYSVDWGDGSGVASIVLASHGTVSHAYTSEGTYAVQVSAKDKDGATSAMFSRNVTIAVREVQGNDLAVGGTVGNDSFDVSPGSGAGKAIVRLNGVNLGTFTVPGAIRAFGGGGSDSVQATGSANSSDTFAIRPNDLRMGALTMLGDSVEKWIASGGSGSDTFQDLGGTATLVGGRGADSLVAGPGSNDWSITNANQGLLNNRVAFSTIEYLVGGAEDDSFRLAEVGKISGRIEGAGGRNLLDYGVWTSDIYVNLSLGTAPNVSSFLQIQNVTGGSGSDTLIGDTNDNVLQGGAGNDIISGEAGNDTLDGNAGRDLLFGGLGGDSLVGSADEDLMAGGVLSYLAGGTSNINRTALNALRTEWIRADITYDARINNLLVGVGDTPIYRFAPETLADDGAVDSIFGSGEQAALDWALIGVGDTVSNLRTGSRVTRF